MASMMYRTWEKKGKEEQQKILKQAETYLDKVDELWSPIIPLQIWKIKNDILIMQLE